MKKCEDYPNEHVKTFNGSTVRAEGYLRLKPEEWLDDSVIETFLKSIAMKSTHSANHRFIILSSLVWWHIELNEPKTLRRVFRGLLLYFSDNILSSFYESESYWPVCVINVHEHIFTMIDPYSPDSNECHVASDLFVADVKHMFEKHDFDYVICRDWIVTTSIHMSSR